MNKKVDADDGPKASAKLEGAENNVEQRALGTLRMFSGTKRPPSGRSPLFRR